MMYECEMLLECIFVLENKFLTSVGEFWEVKSRTVVGDEEYVHLQILLRMFPLGIPVFFCLRRNPLGNVDFVWGKTLWECWFLLGEKSSGVSVVRFSTGELSWGRFKLIVIWSYSRICSNLLEKMKLNWYLVGSRLHNKLLKLSVIWSTSRLHGNLLNLIVIWLDSRLHNKFLREWSQFLSGRIPGLTTTYWS